MRKSIYFYDGRIFVVTNAQAVKLPYDFDSSTKMGELGNVVADIA